MYCEATSYPSQNIEQMICLPEDTWVQILSLLSLQELKIFTVCTKQFQIIGDREKFNYLNRNLDSLEILKLSPESLTILFTQYGKKLRIFKFNCAAKIRFHYNLIQLCPNLHTLNLEKNSLGPKNFKLILWQFKHITNLKHLNLADNKLSDKETLQLSITKVISSLTHLNLSNNFIDLQGIKYLFDPTKQPHLKLVHLNLSNNKISDSDLEKFVSRDVHFRKMSIADIDYFNKKGEGEEPLIVYGTPMIPEKKKNKSEEYREEYRLD